MNTGDDNRKLLTLRKPQSFFMGLGAVVASAIPITFGIWMLWPYFNYILLGCHQRYTSTRCKALWSPSSEPELFAFPVGFTCLIFTPIVCWICCRYVKRAIQDAELDMSDLTMFTILTAFKWQAIAGILHLLILLLGGGLRRISLDLIVAMIFMFFIAIILHALIAVFITLHLALASVCTFRIIALKRRLEVHIQA